jgi:hypothetical protein
MSSADRSAALVAAARDSTDNPPYGPTLASCAFTLGLLTAAQIIASGPTDYPAGTRIGRGG